MTPAAALTELRNIQAQLIQGPKTLGEIADSLEARINQLEVTIRLAISSLTQSNSGPIASLSNTFRILDAGLRSETAEPEGARVAAAAKQEIK